MDLGIAGRRALVCGSSKGLGRACAEALAAEGVEVWLNGRDPDALGAARHEMQASFDLPVHSVAADVESRDGVDAVLKACPAPDIVVWNSGGPKPGRIEDWNDQVWSEAASARMLAPIMMIQAVVGPMRSRGFGRIVAITSAMVKSPRLPMALSTAPRAGLTAFCKALSTEVAADGVTVNCLLPEKIETDRLAQMTRGLARFRGVSNDVARSELLASIPAGRFGRPQDFGAACAFLCSKHAGYITGQNLQLDGGAYPGLF